MWEWQKSDAAYSYLFLFSLFIELQFCLQSAMKCMEGVCDESAEGTTQGRSARRDCCLCLCVCVCVSCDVQTTN